MISEKLKDLSEEKEAAASDAYELGKIKELQIKYKESLIFYQQAAELEPNNTLYLKEVGFAFHTLGQYNKAIEFYQKALASDLKTFGQEHPQVATGWNNLGAAWDSLGEYNKAIEFYYKALASNLKTFGQEHPNVAILWNNLGAAWNSLGEYNKAIEYFQKALKARQQKLGANHPYTKAVKDNIAHTKRRMESNP